MADTLACCCPVCGGWLILMVVDIPALDLSEEIKELHDTARDIGGKVVAIDSADVRAGKVPHCTNECQGTNERRNKGRVHPQLLEVA